MSTSVENSSSSTFETFINASTESEAQEQLSRLISDDAHPIVRSVVASRLGSSIRFRGERDASIDDVVNEIVLKLITRLRAIRTRGEIDAIGNFPGYVATVSYNACHQHMRERYPERARLKLKLRYLFRHDERFKLWDEGGQLRGALTSTPPTSLRVLQPVYDWEAHPAEFVISVLQAGDQSMTLDDLTDLIAEKIGLIEPVAQTPESDDFPDHHIPADTALESRDDLTQLWSEIVELPPRQRIALLLNLRDGQGGSALELFPLTGVVDFGEIARTLELTPEELAALWSDLPLDDHKIAERLGATRQQVINLRKCARERLARRRAEGAAGNKRLKLTSSVTKGGRGT